MRDAAHARVRADDAGGHPQPVAGGSRGRADAADRRSSTTSTCAANADWIDRVVDSLSEHVYITIDVDGLDPAIMPATGTPEPGGLSWYETLTLLRRVIERRTVVGCDVVELSPMPGNVAPNFLCAKLIYKILSYRFGPEVVQAA